MPTASVCRHLNMEICYATHRCKSQKCQTEDKAYKLTDGEGMHLMVHPNGSKYWRLQYRFDGKQKTLALGVYLKLPFLKSRNAVMKPNARLQPVQTSANRRRWTNNCAKRSLITPSKLSLSNGMNTNALTGRRDTLKT